ncbi:MAG: hypothetical protein B7Y26_07665 [Hydrogenophilales bacterium 16-64-46]|nr:MAG: hypothetical protein B7Z32_08205 [Hydrogenophilales bacterium 12-64-13]OYZ05621.1 MAG: hypothetical protein B7Y26_07665 [Hydrogenophilales bacterium 16-64-46]OZA40200.1 MAG: hypothetical protein B7X87_01045 [Hydrogenophilales bacterium 17-64-34]HQT00748.1 heavy metal-associated domain-containing protein [Thiobacillus sp.]
MNEIVLNISGMSCGGCVNSVQAILAALPGVESVEVTLTPGLARVRYDAARIEPAALIKAISDAGFGAH